MEKKLKTAKQLLKTGPTKDEHRALVAERKAIAQRGGRPPAVQPTRDILVANGYEAIKALLPKLVGRLTEALDDKNDPLHERAVDILSKRGIPIAFYEGLSKQEFREDEGGNRSPSIVINVTGTAGIEAVQHNRRDDVVDVESEERDE